MRFGGILIRNQPIECPSFQILQKIQGGFNTTSIEVYGRIDTRYVVGGLSGVDVEVCDVEQYLEDGQRNGDHRIPP